jgi:hypothetical protein
MLVSEAGYKAFLEDEKQQMREHAAATIDIIPDDAVPQFKLHVFRALKAYERQSENMMNHVDDLFEPLFRQLKHGVTGEDWFVSDEAARQMANFILVTFKSWYGKRDFNSSGE